jgi:hypothetical protein
MERQPFYQLDISLDLWEFWSTGVVFELMFENNILEWSTDWAGMEISSLHPLFSVKTMEKAKVKVLWSALITTIHVSESELVLTPCSVPDSVGTCSCLVKSLGVGDNEKAQVHFLVITVTSCIMWVRWLISLCFNFLVCKIRCANCASYHLPCNKNPLHGDYYYSYISYLTYSKKTLFLRCSINVITDFWKYKDMYIYLLSFLEFFFLVALEFEFRTYAC